MTKSAPIRNSDYALFRGKHLEVYPMREQPCGEPLRVILTSSDDQWASSSGFEPSDHSKDWALMISVSALSAAYEVRTYGLVQGLEVSVFEHKPDPALAFVWCRSPASVETHGFMDLANGTFGNTVAFDELTQVWEVRGPSQLELPVPVGMEGRVRLK